MKKINRLITYEIVIFVCVTIAKAIEELSAYDCAVLSCLAMMLAIQIDKWLMGDNK